MDKFFAKQLKQPERKETDAPTHADDAIANGDARPQKLPRGVVLDEHGKPCRSCTSAFEWKKLMRNATGPSTSTSHPLPSNKGAPASSTLSAPDSPPDCPPDVDILGNHTWTLLHSISAAYPPRASTTQQSEMKQFLVLFSKLYPCWVCADDFREWMKKDGNAPRVDGREGLGTWMCEAHNEVNRKLGKKEFDCKRWEERWRTGWKDGSCD